jgi:POT family proton-dependent oligopeptide transporter
LSIVKDEASGFVAPPPGEFIGHPRGLWMLFGSEFWERFAYYGMRARCSRCMSRRRFFALLPQARRVLRASLTYGAYTALIYATGLFGGS